MSDQLNKEMEVDTNDRSNQRSRRQPISSALLVPILAWIAVATWYVWLQIQAGAPSQG